MTFRQEWLWKLHTVPREISAIITDYVLDFYREASDFVAAISLRDEHVEFQAGLFDFVGREEWCRWGVPRNNCCVNSYNFGRPYGLLHPGRRGEFFYHACKVRVVTQIPWLDCSMLRVFGIVVVREIKSFQDLHWRDKTITSSRGREWFLSSYSYSTSWLKMLPNSCLYPTMEVNMP